MPIEIVWLFEEERYAQLIRMDAYFSTVRYSHGGIDYEVLVSNDEFKHTRGEDDGDTD